jgi:hypothetical protein
MVLAEVVEDMDLLQGGTEELVGQEILDTVDTGDLETMEGIILTQTMPKVAEAELE